MKMTAQCACFNKLRFQLDRLKVNLREFLRFSHDIANVDKFDIKGFWKAYKLESSRFNPMYDLSQIYLGIPQSTIKLERDFHALAMTLTCLRSRLSDETLNDLLLVKQNFKFLREFLLSSNKYDLLKPLRVPKSTIPKRSAAEMNNPGVAEADELDEVAEVAEVAEADDDDEDVFGSDGDNEDEFETDDEDEDSDG